MQVDYGEGALTRVPGTDRWRKPRLFVATLRYSRRSYRCVVWRSSQQAWARLHEQAWRYFGGSCRYVVLDNLKEGVLKYTVPRLMSSSSAWRLIGRRWLSADPAVVAPRVTPFRKLFHSAPPVRHSTDWRLVCPSNARNWVSRSSMRTRLELTSAHAYPRGNRGPVSRSGLRWTATICRTVNSDSG
jgi:Integrase core domain